MEAIYDSGDAIGESLCSASVSYAVESSEAVRTTSSRAHVISARETRLTRARRDERVMTSDDLCDRLMKNDYNRLGKATDSWAEDEATGGANSAETKHPEHSSVSFRSSGHGGRLVTGMGF